jgi:hypothetical protein
MAYQYVVFNSGGSFGGWVDTDVGTVSLSSRTMVVNVRELTCLEQVFGECIRM